MYCPDCGTENSNALKFCTRCGTNLKAIESARAVVTEISAPGSSNQLDMASIVRTIQWLRMGGFFLITLGAYLITLATDHSRYDPPIGLFFAIAGFVALILIIRRLIRMLDAPQIISKEAPPIMHLPASGTTQQLPPVGVPYSVVEEQTRQFER